MSSVASNNNPPLRFTNSASAPYGSYDVAPTNLPLDALLDTLLNQSWTAVAGVYFTPYTKISPEWSYNILYNSTPICNFIQSGSTCPTPRKYLSQMQISLEIAIGKHV